MTWPRPLGGGWVDMGGKGKVLIISKLSAAFNTRTPHFINQFKTWHHSHCIHLVYSFLFQDKILKRSCQASCVAGSDHPPPPSIYMSMNMNGCSARRREGPGWVRTAGSKWWRKVRSYARDLALGHSEIITFTCSPFTISNHCTQLHTYLTIHSFMHGSEPKHHDETETAIDPTNPDCWKGKYMWRITVCRTLEITMDCYCFGALCT